VTLRCGSKCGGLVELYLQTREDGILEGIGRPAVRFGDIARDGENNRPAAIRCRSKRCSQEAAHDQGEKNAWITQ
jgi:hypothetical protein